MFKPTKKTTLEFKKVSFGYEPKRTILNNVSFSIKEKEHVCIIGPNGCGKSTLVKLIACLFKPTNGLILYRGKKITKENVRNLKNDVGIIFENPDNQFIGLTVQDDIAFGLENKCIPRNKMQNIIDKAANYVGIQHLLKHDTKTLSGGQKQLVALASILALDPKIIIFDEVTSMLDARSKQKINKIIQFLKEKMGKTIITITHDMNEAAKADRIIVLKKGQIILSGNPKQVFVNPIIKSLSFDKPFVCKLIEKLHLKPEEAIKIVRGINYEK